MNHTRFIVMAMLTNTDVGNLHSLCRKTFWKMTVLQHKDNYATITKH